MKKQIFLLALLLTGFAIEIDAEAASPIAASPAAVSQNVR
jgi:hypothetical protein